MKKLILLLLLIHINSFAFYGEDDRKEFFEIKTTKMQEVAKATAYQVERHIELRGWTFSRLWKIITHPFENQNICPEEKYVKQPAMRKNCSGTLVAPDMLLTAGNCLTEHYCYNDLYYWMFDYNLKSADQFNPKRSKQNFYLCDKVVKRVFNPSKGISFALIKLKKKVKKIAPVKIVSSSDLRINDRLVVMGHMRGLPLKVDDRALISDLSEESLLLGSDLPGIYTLGAGVYNQSYELEGIIVHGSTGYYKTESGCLKEQVNDDSAGSEVVIRSSLFAKYIENN